MHAAGVVAYPTEAVWGLGCDPWSEPAVAKILRLKRRSVGKGVILIAHSMEQFAPFLSGLDQSAHDRLKASWPGPATWLVPNNGVAPDWISGGRSTLALRVTNHPLASALCKVFGGPIVSTSANPQGLPAATTALKVRSYFGSQLESVTPGRVGEQAKPSEIRHLLTGEIIRPG